MVLLFHVMTTITCKIPPELDAQLEAVAHQKHVSKSEIVRGALEKDLKENSKRMRLTAYDLVKHLSGSLHGPKDLSVNPEYLEGFGE